MGIVYDEQNLTANGGTELMMRGLESRLDPKFFDGLVLSRNLAKLEEASKGVKRVFWAHEVPATPQSDMVEYQHLANKRWQGFDAMVCVSNWQMLEYARSFQFRWPDWQRTRVMLNAIDPIPAHDKPHDKIRLIYMSSPQRGLKILYDVFQRLCQKHDDIELEVFSSFKLYQNPLETDQTYHDLFARMQDDPRVIYRGLGTNQDVREAITRAHIFAYPCIWGETSCLSLIEAMSGGLLCVHPNNAALFETACGITNMYHYPPEGHADVFYTELDRAINQWKTGDVEHLSAQKAHADRVYSWKHRVPQWERLLTELREGITP
jgi:glycosyltransferase involved in cell wall biosynthesis